MKKVAKILSVILVLVPAALFAQRLSPGQLIQQKGSFLRPLQQRDSVLIADQLRYGFTIEGIPEGTGISLPDYSKNFMDSVEVVGSWTLDTIKVNKKGRKDPNPTYDIEGSIVITSFDEGVYQLPALAMLRISPDGVADTLVFDPQILEVKTMPVDTTTYVVHDIKGQIRYPVTFKEVLPYVLGGLLLVALATLAVYLLRRRKKLQEEEQRKEPAYIVALRKLEKYRGEKNWTPEKQKQYYTGITDALREYIVDRFEVDAMEMTTAEIFAALKDKDIQKDLYNEAKSLFETADFVKFAKHLASEQENINAVPSAVRFVTATYQTSLEQQSAQADDQGSQTGGPTDGQGDRKDEPEAPDYSAYMPK